MPFTIIVSLITLDFNFLVCHVKSVYKFPVGQEESHKVVLLDIRYIKDEAKG